jgi:hypothetical protein
MIVNVLIGFLDLKNVGIDTRILILGEFVPEILPIFDFGAAILKNGDITRKLHDPDCCHTFLETTGHRHSEKH